MNIPPDYLDGKTKAPSGDSPAKLLLDGQWCGHGEPNFGVFDIQAGQELTFRLRLPVSDAQDMNPPVVTAQPQPGAAFAIYDSRRHLASLFYREAGDDKGAIRRQQNFACPQCGQDKFQASVGFEIPGDSETPNDTSWFALSVRCANCEWMAIIYDDETA